MNQYLDTVSLHSGERRGERLRRSKMSETISKNRGLARIDVDQLPTPPSEFKPSATSDIQALRKLADKAEAEAILALEESEKMGGELSKKLGEDVPSTAHLADLLAWKRSLTAVKARLAFLTQFVEEQEDIANNDIVVALGEITDAFDYKVKKRPELQGSFPALQKYGNTHSDSIKEGIARSKERQEKKSE
jgi:hypothetical protein